MKMTIAICLLFVGVLGSEALAHGGVYKGPSGGVPPGLRDTPAPPPTLACDCALPECTRCSHRALASGERLARKEIVEQVTQRWNDFAALRITATFRSKEERPIEAYAMLAPAAAFAATGGSIRQGDSVLTGSLQPSRDARRRYLWAKAHGLDPFLLTRRTPSRYHLRAFPVRADGDTVVQIDGFALASPETRGAPRFYRTADRVLVVRDTTAGAPPEAGEWEDEKVGRALSFHALADARKRYGGRIDRATPVPFVPAMETALKGAGTAAAGADTVLIALEPGAPLPPLPPPEPARG